MIYKVDNGYIISSGGSWLPGCYEDERTARYAFQFKDEVLQRLQDAANARPSWKGGGVITRSDLVRERTSK